MAIPFPGEVFGPPLHDFWTAYGDAVILPILAWIAFISSPFWLWASWKLSEMANPHAIAREQAMMALKQSARQAPRKEGEK